MASSKGSSAAASGTEIVRAEKRAWNAPKLVVHGSIRAITRGNASGSMADNMFGGAVGSGMM